ncbi:PREDICTED: ralBP1-associated Eps domain-containing protein 1 [Nicrophorus vespilloides]|uniref:RalBP1-associated Eps domain-containing protein 1 n=1 Tax=Nicrophorus vespilloides TaxID=110193 RepID=A0ABM1MX66_NICVS|nr:PREDICTED: ralBP1-associated Eps domain-containing protein 1 [Nicrophorus vespilloides]
MEELHLSEALQRYFCDLFVCCDDEKSGKVNVNKLLDIIKSGCIPEEVIDKIAEICWSQTTNYLNRKQFCYALKLVAAHLVNIPVTSEVLGIYMDGPLPRFNWPQIEGQSDLIELRSADYREHVDPVSTDSEVDSETLSIGRNGSPSSTASDSPTPTNSVQDRSWAISGTWQGLVSEEQRQLLGTEEESSDRHSSEEDTEVSNEVWTITSEQKEYYTAQFRSLQADTNALLAGPIARMFFEKSRLPVQELRKIWQLADVTKDGALSLEEFNTAMHLVVLRRNHIELPDVLPMQLIPGNETPMSVTPETEPILSPQTKDTAKEWTKFFESPTNSVSSPGPKPVNFDFQQGAVDKDPKILHPVALRLTPEVLAAQAEDDDGNSPKKFLENSQQITAIQRPQPKKFNLPGPGAIPPPPPPNSTNIAEDGPVSLPAFPPPKKEKPPPPPPRPFKTHGRSSSLDLNRLNKNLAPPSVPPRVSPNVQQSAKKLVNQKSEGDCGAKANEGEFANFEQFEKYENVTDEIFPGDQYEAERKKLFAQFSVQDGGGVSVGADATDAAPRKHGAFEVYRKPTPKSRDSPANVEEKAKFDLFMQLQDQNTVLLRLCQELSQELVEVKEAKVALKVMLEKQLNGGG